MQRLNFYVLFCKFMIQLVTLVTGVSCFAVKFGLWLLAVTCVAFSRSIRMASTGVDEVIDPI